MRDKPRPFPKHASAFRDRHGKLRTRFRQKGRKTYYFEAEAFSAAWWEEYKACCDGREADTIKPGEGRIIAGSVNELITRYYESRDWQGPNPTTRHSLRLGRVDKRDSQAGGFLIQSCFLGSSGVSRRPDGRGMGSSGRTVAA